MRMLRAVIETNDAQPDEVVRLLERELGDLAGAEVAVLGLAFKPDTDDVRESPAIPIVSRIVERGGIVTIHDPVVRALPPELDNGHVTLTSVLRDAIAGRRAIVLVTRWREYEELPELVAETGRQLLVVDGRRVLEKSRFERYVGVGT
jgi:UDPglucose 6-dehydrogenase/GDP-mannose 6-dehydrogenase